MIRVEWSEAKRRSNLRKHHLDFTDTKTVFVGAVTTFEDDRFDYSEERFISLGLLQGTVVVIAHTESEALIRVIAMRKATDYERRIYLAEFTDKLGNS